MSGTAEYQNQKSDGEVETSKPKPPSKSEGIKVPHLPLCEIREKLGAGSYSEVFVVNIEGVTKAIKIGKRYKYVAGFETIREADFLIRCSHPNIVRMEKVYPTKYVEDKLPEIKNPKYNYDKYGIVLEKGDTDLAKLMEEQVSFSNDEIRQILYQLLLALEYLHNQGIMHRDIKPGNIIVFNQENSTVFKFTDFGLSKQSCAQEENTPRPTTFPYQSPEIILGGKYTNKSDMWTIGCILWELLTGTMFLLGDTERAEERIHEIIKKHPEEITREDIRTINGTEKASRKLPPSEKTWDYYFPRIDRNILSLLKGLLSFNPNKRWTATQALNSKFFKPVAHRIDEVRQQTNRIVEFTYEVKDNHLTKQLLNYLTKYVELIGVFKIPTPKNIKAWNRSRLFFLTYNLILSYTAKVEYREEMSKNLELKFYTLLYLSIKYIYSLDFGPSWAKVVPEKYTTPESLKLREDFEDEVISVLKCVVYTTNPYDTHKKYLGLHEVRNLLNFLINSYTEINGMTAYEVFEKFENTP